MEKEIISFCIEDIYRFEKTNTTNKLLSGLMQEIDKIDRQTMYSIIKMLDKDIIVKVYDLPSIKGSQERPKQIDIDIKKYIKKIGKKIKNKGSVYFIIFLSIVFLIKNLNGSLINISTNFNFNITLNFGDKEKINVNDKEHNLNDNNITINATQKINDQERNYTITGSIRDIVEYIATKNNITDVNVYNTTKEIIIIGVSKSYLQVKKILIEYIAEGIILIITPRVLKNIAINNAIEKNKLIFSQKDIREQESNISVFDDNGEYNITQDVIYKRDRKQIEKISKMDKIQYETYNKTISLEFLSLDIEKLNNSCIGKVVDLDSEFEKNFNFKITDDEFIDKLNSSQSVLLLRKGSREHNEMLARMTYKIDPISHKVIDAYVTDVYYFNDVKIKDTPQDYQGNNNLLEPDNSLDEKCE